MLKVKEVKKPFPMRFSDQELKWFKQAAGKRPLREWMRETLLIATPAYRELKSMADPVTGIVDLSRVPEAKSDSPERNQVRPVA